MVTSLPEKLVRGKEGLETAACSKSLEKLKRASNGVHTRWLRTHAKKTDARAIFR